MSPVRAAAYVRVSSDQQDFDLQRSEIEKAAAARGDEIAVWFEEKGSSGRRDGQELAKLLQEIAGGRVRKLYIFALDRLSRMGVGQIMRYFHHFAFYECPVVTVADAFDPAGPAGDVILAVFAWVAQQERTRLQQRMAAKKKDVIAKGGRWGRPRKVDKVTLEAARALQKKGHSLREICMRLKVKKATLHRALSEPK
jgi:DNA invertase Pin-like site-specific DNA recombinase